MASRHFLSSINRAARVIVVSVALVFALPTVQAKDKTQEFTQIFTHTYDEVFQAVPDTIERMGLFVTDKNDKSGLVNGKGSYKAVLWNGVPYNYKMTFSIHVETVSAKPETKVTIDVSGGAREFFARDFFRELQKVLATYK